MPTENILVVGGAGYIGSHMVQTLHEKGMQPIVLDNLSTGHADILNNVPHIIGDVSDHDLLRRLFEKYHIKTVMHFASCSDVAESNRDPLKYYDNNVTRLIQLLAIMTQCSVKHFIFSSSAAVYGNPEILPINETHPLRPISAYGRSKLMMEEIIKDAGLAHDVHYAILRYFNVAGANVNAKLAERHQPENHLIPKVLHVAAGIQPVLYIYGDQYATLDGTCIRDYIHVQDICDVHLLALNALLKNETKLILNIGTGKGHSVLEVIQEAEAVTQKKIPYKIELARLGDASVLIAEAQLLKHMFDWQPKYPQLKSMIKHAWEVFERSNVHS